MSDATKIILFILVTTTLFTVFKMLKYRKSHFVTSSIIGSLCLAFFFTISSVFWTTDVAYDTETIKHLEFGWPMVFVVQNQERYQPPFPYVAYLSLELSSNTPEYPANQVLTKNFYLSLALNLLGIILIWLIVDRQLRLRDEINHSDTSKLDGGGI